MNIVKLEKLFGFVFLTIGSIVFVPVVFVHGGVTETSKYIKNIKKGAREKLSYINKL